MRRPALATFAAFVTGASLFAAPSPARADQFVILDVTYTHDGMSHNYFDPSPNQPFDWTSPVDYANGTLYWHYEVEEKPSDEGIEYNMCLEQDNGYIGWVMGEFTTTGSYDGQASIKDFWGSGQMDLTMPIKRLPLIVKDHNGTKIDPGNDFDGAPDISLYFPMKIHARLTIVSAGDTLHETSDAGAAGASSSDGNAGADAVAGAGGNRNGDGDGDGSSDDDGSAGESAAGKGGSAAGGHGGVLGAEGALAVGGASSKNGHAGAGAAITGGAGSSPGSAGAAQAVGGRVGAEDTPRDDEGETMSCSITNGGHAGGAAFGFGLAALLATLRARRRRSPFGGRKRGSPRLEGEVTDITH